MAESTPKSYATDPTLFLYTSLTAGSSHIITATSRLETILKANKIPFRALDVATDEKARMLWGRRAKGRKLPGLVKFGNIVGDLDQIEEWNEYGELKMQIRATSSMTAGAPPSIGSNTGSPSNAPGMRTASTVATPTPSPAPSSARHIQIQDPPEKPSSTGGKEGDSITLALRQASSEAAEKARENTKAKYAPAALAPSTTKTDKSPKVETKKEEEKEEEKGSEEANKVNDAEKESKPEPTANEDVSPALELPESSAGLSEVPTPVRPGLRKDSAAVSTPNIQAENVRELGLVDHHRSSGVSATSREERASVAEERATLAKDISSIKEEAAKDGKNDTVVEEEEEEEEDEDEDEEDEPEAEEREKGDSKEEKTESKAKVVSEAVKPDSTAEAKKVDDTTAEDAENKAATAGKD